MDLLVGIGLVAAGFVGGVVACVLFLFLVAEDHEIVDPEGAYHKS